MNNLSVREIEEEFNKLNFPPYSKKYSIYGTYIIYIRETYKFYIGSGNLCRRKHTHIELLKKRKPYKYKFTKSL